MAMHLTKQEGDVMAGVIGYRDKTGAVTNTVPFYRPTDEQSTLKHGLTASERAVCQNFVHSMAEAFGQYIESQNP